MSVDGPFNQIPAQCQDACPLTQEDIDRHGMVVTRNCDSPSFNEDPQPDRTVEIRAGEVVSVSKKVGEVVTIVACRNKGVNLWLSTLIDQSNN